MLDDAFKKYSELLDDVATRMDDIQTEEDAKIQLVQTTLIDVLGWKTKEITAERKHDSGYSDYILQSLGEPFVVVEAKRIGRISIATAEKGKQKPFRISGPALVNALGAIEQARQYASDEGISLFAVTDGDLWIVGKTNVSARKWRDAEAIVFPSMAAVSDSFSLFYDLLAASQVRKHLYKSIFDEIHQGRVGFERELFSAYPISSLQIEKKSSLAFDLDRVFDVYFSRMKGEDDPDLLVNCFVESRESRIADFSLEKMTAKILGNINPDFQNIDVNLAAVVSDAVDLEGGQTVFIIGPTGAGKTTFLDRFFRKTLPSVVRDKCIVANVNMLDSLGDARGAVWWLVEQLVSQFEKEMFASGYPIWEDLLGLYFGEYKRRSEGEGRVLYESDPERFKIEFGEYVGARVREDREGYLKRLVSDIVVNRKKLPVLVIDNMDELNFDAQKVIFQACQAIRRHAKHMLLLVPITDKSAWLFSKSDIFSIYSSRSFFLPTPSPREVFRKRIEYLRAKAEISISEESKISQHFLSKGIRVSISDLNAFARVLEEVFVDNEYASKIIGELSNYNTRRMLALSRRVMTSSVFDVDELIKSVIGGGGLSANPRRFMTALLRGDYSFFREGDTSEVISVFKLSSKLVYSPLLMLRVLSLLDLTYNSGRSIEERHLSFNSIFSYFDAMGVSEASVSSVIGVLHDARLIESFDNSSLGGDLGQSFAITYSGMCHLRLALSNGPYFEQMALTSEIDDSAVAQEIRSTYLSDGWIGDRLKKTRSRFAEYLLGADGSSIREIPSAPQFTCQMEVTNRIKRFLVVADTEKPEGDAAPITLEGKLDWFDFEKGYGFIRVAGNLSGVYLKDKVLFASGFKKVTSGDTIKFEAENQVKGLSVTRVLGVDSGNDAIVRMTITVTRIFWERKYGFARSPNSEKDVFFHFSALSTDVIAELREGNEYVADVSIDVEDGNYEVRAIIGAVG